MRVAIVNFYSAYSLPATEHWQTLDMAITTMFKLFASPLYNAGIKLYENCFIGGSLRQYLLQNILTMVLKIEVSLRIVIY